MVNGGRSGVWVAITAGVLAGAVGPGGRCLAEMVHGVAMHGTPTYAAGYRHFDYVDPTAPTGGELRLGAHGTFDSVNPLIVKGAPAAGRHLTYESLLARAWNEPFSLYALIAQGVEIADDRSRVTFALNPAARWHDGTPITIADILFSWRTLRDQGRPNHRFYYGRVARADTPAPGQVRFVFKPNPDGTYDRELPMIMGLMPILSETYYRDRAFARTTLEPPPTSGPYRLAEVSPGRFVRYDRVDEYWGRDLPSRVGFGHFDSIRYDYYRDETIAFEAFKVGEVDFWSESNPARWATGYDFPAVNDGRVVVEELANGRPARMIGLVFNTRRAIFADRRTREALGFALDFEWLNKVLFHGVYRRTMSYYANSELAARGAPSADERALLAPFRDRLPAGVLARAFTLPHTDGSGPRGHRRNLRRALTLLADAGWQVSDGRLVGPSGEQFAFEIMLNDPANEKVALQFGRSLERIGIAVSVRTVDSSQYQARLDEFDFDMIIGGWISTLSPGNEQLYYYGSAAADQPGSRNYPGIRSEVVDHLAASLSQTRTRQQLVTAVRALDRVLLWGHYVIPLYHQPHDRVAYWRKLRRPAVTPVYGPMIESWWAGR